MIFRQKKSRERQLTVMQIFMYRIRIFKFKQNSFQTLKFNHNEANYTVCIKNEKENKLIHYH